MYSDEDRLRDWIEDIVENAANAQRYVEGLSFEAFGASGLVRDACERCIERIAEAAVRVVAERMATIAQDTMLHQCVASAIGCGMNMTGSTSGCCGI